MIRIAIVEDEVQEYEILHRYLMRYGQEKSILFEIEYFPNAVDFVSDYHYGFDLIFMDIVMPDFNGMQAAERLRRVDAEVSLIFVTNMAQFAIQGYNVSARYFILKPVKYSDFAQKLELTIIDIEKNRNNNFIMLNLPYEKRRIFERDIKYVEIFAHDVIFHTYTEDVHVRGTLAEYEKKLNQKKFCRINSCYLVNLDFVTAVKERSVFIDDLELGISYARKKNLMKALAEYGSYKF